MIHKHTHHAIVHQARSPCLRLGAGAERIIDAITLRDNFPEDCGPWREHDFGSLKVFLHGMTMASLDPSDPSVTKRIITIMLAEEY
ncbi:DUF3768 domain-containing protein [Bradyrhizobium japonicum]|uniref:DUF3768 domain-containing protein n=1 Tax=Bradyrhizobium japonicum TaxID=375 RepID=UPI001E39FBA3|nr:DUF3768 domain-containing protein [Bradyrhizobium japonicum]MCD9825246.1 hypothetical protein [Bradyrhizobium japonicum]MCD9898264.1 hypothetical protein [Bradyrhizobium japonicum]MEB2671245.1 hypothetical protein [Bradyrhizobium japonicum]WLB28525.1 hypothetical protein QIH85_43135 [Bradyrhizobium japonicum]WRI90559.1 hypothetical protein R3F75_06435 [Bradyrhizobium japonicum]